MAIYRSDQAQLTFAAEAAPGGSPERAEWANLGTATTLDGATVAGARTIAVTSASGASITTITEEYTQAEATKTITTS